MTFQISMGGMPTYTLRLSGLTALFFLGYTSAYSESTVCYGDPFLIPKYLAPPAFRGKIFYTPKNGLQRLVVDDGKTLDQHFAFFRDTYSKLGWTHEDEGTITVPSRNEDIFISVVDCTAPRLKRYGDSISFLLSSSTQSVQFVSSRSSLPVVLWSRTGPGSGRGVMEGYRYAIFHLTQKDSGYYNFRGDQNELLRWSKLEVTNYVANLSRVAGDELHYRYPFKFTEWKARRFPFHPKQPHDSDSRVKMTDTSLDIEHVETSDTGLYEFVDYDNNVMLQIHLKVTDKPLSVGMIMGTTVAALVVLICCCCCCVKRCGSKKSDKYDEATPENSPVSEPAPEPSPEPEPPNYAATAPPAGPAMYHHPMINVVNGPNTQPSGLSVPSSEPPSYSVAMADVNPSPEFQVSGQFGSATASSDPQFDIRGVTFPSAPPLSTDTYNSEKINFL